MAPGTLDIVEHGQRGPRREVRQPLTDDLRGGCGAEEA